MRYGRSSIVLIVPFLVLAAVGCDSGDSPSPKGKHDVGPADSGTGDDVSPAFDVTTDLHPADAGGDADQPDASGDAGEPDAGPAMPDLQLPDLGPLDLGLQGCQLQPCPGNQLCDEQGVCQEPAVCAADADCLGGRICLEASCSEPCWVTGCDGVTWCHVPTGRCREAGSCETTSGCLPGRVCAGLDGRCVPAPPPACGPELPCPGGLRCGARGACEEPWRCAADSDCLPGRVCGGDARCTPCRTDEDCPGEQSCAGPAAGGPACREPEACLADEDCPGTRLCSPEGRCAPAGDCPADPFEPDDAPGQARLAAPRLYERSFCDGETDRLLLDVPAGQGLQLIVRGDGGDGEATPSFDPALTLLRADTAEPLAFDDVPGPVETIVLPLATVDLTVEVLIQARPGDQGPYTLQADLVPGGSCPDDAGEGHGGDDAQALARPIAPGLHLGRLCPGDTDWFELEVPEGGARLTARLDGRQLGGGGGPTLALYAAAGPAVEQGLEVERDLPAGQIWLEVSGGAAAAGPYTLLVELATPAAQARCSAAPLLVPGTAQAGATAGPGTTANGCGPAAGAAAEAVPESLLRIELAAAAAVDLTLSGVSDPDTTLALRSLCSEPGSELACVRGEGTLRLPRLPAGSYTVVVEGGTAEAGADFEVLLTTGEPGAPPENDLCPGARPVVFNPQGSASISGTLLHAGNELELARCTPPAGLPETFFKLHLDEPALLTASTDGETRPWLTLISSCALPVELGCAAPGRKLTINDLPAGDYLLVAQGFPAEGTDGRFVLRADLEPVAGPDTCMGARSVGPGAVFNEETSGLSKYDLPPNGCTGGNTQGPDMPFAVHLEAGQTLRAVLLAAWDGGLYLVRDCEDVAASCVAGVDQTVGGIEETLVWTADEPGDYYLIVDAYSRQSSGPFRLTVAVDGECMTHQECPQGFRCVSFHCLQPECAEDGDCPVPGSRCVDERCLEPACVGHATCQERGEFCVDNACAAPPGEPFGSGLLALTIPDDDAGGLVTALEVPDLGPLGGLRVQLELEHPYQGDLVVGLVSPAGTRVRLHNQTGGSTPFGQVVYGLTRDPDGPGLLADLAGEPTAGPWLLEVQDLSPGDEGVLQAWAVYLD